MTKLPTLGGPNGYANMINNRGEMVGLAENNTQDPGCPVHQFEPVVWENGQIRDPYGVAAQINDNGQVVGASGTRAAFNPNTGLFMVKITPCSGKETARSTTSATSACPTPSGTSKAL